MNDTLASGRCAQDPVLLLGEALGRLELAVADGASALQEARAMPVVDPMMTSALKAELGRLEQELIRLRHEQLQHLLRRVSR